MKLIKPSFEIIEQQPQEVGVLKHIEACGRVAWKSEERTTEDSYIKFLEMLKGVNHGSVLEHGTVYLSYKATSLKYVRGNYIFNPYTKIKYNNGLYYITTNYRVLVENNWLDDLEYQCEPTEFHEKRVTVRMVCDRGVSHEFVRHRTFSFTQESTRYCNYSKDKFGSELTFITPEWLIDWDVESINNGNWENCDEDAKQYADLLQKSQEVYFFLLDCPNRWKPQQARAVLPNSLKTELIMTGFISDWKHFFHLRTAPGAHPQAQEITIPLQKEFIKLGLI